MQLDREAYVGYTQLPDADLVATYMTELYQRLRDYGRDQVYRYETEISKLTAKVEAYKDKYGEIDSTDYELPF